MLLNQFTVKPERAVRLAIASLITSLSRVTISANEWPELLNFLLSMSQADSPEHREIAMMLFRFLTETIDKPLKPHFKKLQQMFIQGLNDQQSNKVRVKALRALEALSELLENSWRLARTLPPSTRRVFDLYFGEGLSIQEIAARLGVSVNTVKTQRRNALQRIREIALRKEWLLIIPFFRSFL